jgi:ketosteroid isomerase-like protein
MMWLQQVSTILANWVTAVNRCDVDAVMQLFAADVFFTGHQPKH